jgi:hypothetical protein
MGSFTEIAIPVRQLGFRSALNVKILRDALPWDSYALDSTLAGIGISAGTGTGQYYIFSSADLYSLETDPLNDLLIISNDQPQGFYDLLAANLNIIGAFASGGGVVLWETCDLAWNYGSYAAAGIDSFPGGITQNTHYDFINLAPNHDLLLTGDLADSIRGNYASNKYFFDVPDSAIVYMVNSGGEPTLLALKYGHGTIFFSGQPLEYNFDRRENYDAGLLLPRIIGFMLGRAWDYPAPINTGPDRTNSARSG